MRTVRAATLLAALAAAAPAAAQSPATVYHNGDILTMAGDTPQYVEAVVVRDGKIAFVGAKADAIAKAGAGAKTVDLAGKTMLPGFIDTHGHFIYFGKNLVDADLFGTKDVADSSRHLGAANSVAFKAAGIFAATPDPVGGSLARKADGTSLAGPMEETAPNAVREKRPPFTGTLADQVGIGASNLWASYGQTTAMECGPCQTAS